MARAARRLAVNTPGELYVEDSCIDCDLCRQLAPSVFARSDRDGQSYVASQPHDAATRHRALMALVTCPTTSIRTADKVDKADSHAAARAFPEAAGDNIYFCGYASASSYGAASWLLTRPDGNVLIDSPRAAAPLMDRIADLGGVRWMFLTHRDDVADHMRWHERFGCERVIHEADAASVPGCERTFAGEGELAPDLVMVPVPGHTRGSAVLIHRERHAFTGDHVWASDAEDGLDAGRGVCWYSWPEQRRSMERLATHRFVEVIPGHGRRWRATSVDAMQAELRRLVAAMR